MDFIPWSEKNTIDIEMVDSHHREIFRLINGLYTEIHGKNKRNTVSAMLEELVRYMRYHFSTEENLLKEHSFPHVENHRLVHEKFLSDVTDFQHSYIANGPDLTLDLLKFLKNWLLSHIFILDRQYAGYIQEKTIQPDTAA